MAALLAALNLPAWEYLTTGDVEKKALLVAVGRRALELRQRLDRNLAIEIVNSYGKALKRG